MFEGTSVALITPFRKDGGIDEAGIRKLVRIQEDCGTDIIVPCGTTGESATLSHEEHMRVIDIVVSAVKKCKVLAGTGSNNTVEAIRLTKHAEDAGCDGALLISPYYNKPTQKGIIEHYKAVAAKVDLPILIYNVPGRTSVNIEAKTTIELSKVNNIVGIKEASGNVSQIMQVLKAVKSDFAVLSGDDSLTYPLMTLGAKGIVSVTANVVPREMTRMVRSLQNKKYEEARKIHYRLLPLFQNLFIETNPIPVKTAMRLMKLPSGGVRLPLCEMSEHNLEILKNTLRELRLIR
jgi:4-hydroxy-tetrahydrodipicolinate synthase